MQNFSCLGWLKLLNYTFPGGRPAGRPAKPEINANLSPAWLAGAWAELGNMNAKMCFKKDRKETIQISLYED